MYLKICYDIAICEQQAGIDLQIRTNDEQNFQPPLNNETEGGNINYLSE